METRTKDACVSDDDWSARSATVSSPLAEKTPQRGFRRPAKPGLSVHNLEHKTCQCRSTAIWRRCRFESERIRRSSSAPANLVITSRSIPGGRRASGERARRGDQSQPLVCVVVGAVGGCSILCCPQVVVSPARGRGLPRARPRNYAPSPTAPGVRSPGVQGGARAQQAAAERRIMPSARAPETRAEGVTDA